MIVDQETKWLDTRSIPTYTAAALPLPRTSGTAATQPRPHTSVTCTSTFSDAEVGSKVTITPTSAQDTPRSGGVVEELARTLEEDGERIIHHDPSTSLAIGGECSVVLSQSAKGDEHSSRVNVEEGAAGRTTAAAVVDPASYSPQEEMLHRGTQVHGWVPLETRRDATNMLSAVPECEQEVEWDVEYDNDVLRFHWLNRWNLVLDSMNPQCTPHIVITPTEDTCEDQYISWQNRLEFQWTGCLTVPQLDFTIGRLPVAQPLFDHTSASSLDHSSAPIPQLDAPSVFNPSRFRNLTQSASVERLVLTQVIKALQKVQCKVVYLAASIFARAFRERYDVPNVISNVGPVFKWNDPAEPILQLNHRLLGTTILDSHCPFVTPHIIINAPPPQALELTANNATPYEQDAAFGQHLIVFVSRHATEVINKPECWSNDSSSYSSYGDELEHELAHYEDSSDVDLFEGLSEHGSDSPPSSGTPMPGTPIDDDDDHRFFFARHGHSDGHGHDDSATISFINTGYSSVYPSSDADSQRATQLKVTSRPMFFIDEDEDELPSLDDW